MEINIEKITKIYQQGANASPGVLDIDVKIPSGEFFFLLGPSGCGKTTLLRLIAGLIEPTSGMIRFDGRDVTDLPVEKRNAAMVFQGYALWPHMTVYENVEFGPRMQGIERAERKQQVKDQLHRVKMTDYSDRKPNQLSGGQQQRIALARALAAGSDCLLLDEPLSNLDARLRLHMREELLHLVKSSGITAVYVTHDQKEALSMADRMAVMDSGRIVQVGTPEEIYNHPATRFVADFLGEANFIPGKLSKKGTPSEIRIKNGMIKAVESKKIQEGEEVICCIRPEHIRWASGEKSENDPRSSILSATIKSKTYLGEVRQYCCVLDQEDMEIKMTVLADGPDPMEVGQSVKLEIPARHVVVLEK
ncbi:MAG: ABC transporter ATP-binding protein [Proteobacteria bacterium]|nr:ABC transporter ATP-binding protein [Pseudomonadota bacterium]